MKRRAQANLSERLNDWMRRHYGRSLGWVLRHRLPVIGLFIAFLVGGVLAFKQSGGEFLPAVDDGRVMVKVRMPAGRRAGSARRASTARIESLVRDDPRVAVGVRPDRWGGARTLYQRHRQRGAGRYRAGSG
ncbi:MAG: efflux RND transporter permease subunit [Chromatiales bacterium]|nr:efflux RND transporter permease subunit [Chromatiales bacterium]